MKTRIRIRIRIQYTDDECDRLMYNEDDRAYLSKNNGKVFLATRHNMNYWKLPNGMLIHIYDIIELRREDHMKTKFKVGMEVWCVRYGNGVVQTVDYPGDQLYPVEVLFDGQGDLFTMSGQQDKHEEPSLFIGHRKKSLDEDILPPKRWEVVLEKGTCEQCCAATTCGMGAGCGDLGNALGDCSAGHCYKLKEITE